MLLRGCTVCVCQGKVLLESILRFQPGKAMLEDIKSDLKCQLAQHTCSSKVQMFLKCAITPGTDTYTNLQVGGAKSETNRELVHF